MGSNTTARDKVVDRTGKRSLKWFGPLLRMSEEQRLNVFSENHQEKENAIDLMDHTLGTSKGMTSTWTGCFGQRGLDKDRNTERCW